MARFLKDKRKAKGQAPGSLIFIGQQAIEHIRIYRTQYSSEYYKEEQITQPQQLRKDLSDKYVTWISIHGLHETEVIAELGQQFEIDPLILEDILNTDERPKFSEDSRHLFIITKSLQFNKETCKVKIEQISIIVGRNYLISFQESETEHFQDVKQRLLNKQSKIRSYSSDYLCYAFIDTLIDNYILNIERFGSVIEEQEKILLIPNKQTVENIYHYKTESKTSTITKLNWHISGKTSAPSKKSSPALPLPTPRSSTSALTNSCATWKASPHKPPKPLKSTIQWFPTSKTATTPTSATMSTTS